MRRAVRKGRGRGRGPQPVIADETRMIGPQIFAGSGAAGGAGAGGGGPGGPSGSGKGQSGQSGSAGQALNVAEAGADEMFPGEAAPGRSREKGLLSPERQKRCGRRQGTDTPDRGRFRGFGPEFRSGAGTVRRAGSVVRPGNSRHGARLSAAPMKNHGRAMYLSRMRSGVGMLAEAGAEREVAGDTGAGKDFYFRKGRGEYTEGPGAVGKLPGQGAGCC